MTYPSGLKGRIKILHWSVEARVWSESTIGCLSGDAWLTTFVRLVCWPEVLPLIPRMRMISRTHLAAPVLMMHQK